MNQITIYYGLQLNYKYMCLYAYDNPQRLSGLESLCWRVYSGTNLKGNKHGETAHYKKLHDLLLHVDYC
jgi:hypothetical protein